MGGNGASLAVFAEVVIWSAQTRAGLATLASSPRNAKTARTGGPDSRTWVSGCFYYSVARGLLRFRAEGGQEIVCGPGVEHIISCEPGAAELADAVADFFHVAGVVRVSVDDDFAAEFASEA